MQLKERAHGKSSPGSQVCASYHLLQIKRLDKKNGVGLSNETDFHNARESSVGASRRSSLHRLLLLQPPETYNPINYWHTGIAQTHSALRSCTPAVGCSLQGQRATFLCGIIKTREPDVD